MPPPWTALRRSSAFSLIELLVVIASLAVLLSLLLPAVQKAREAANRMRCTNNLRQIGVALHNYHNTYDTFPPGGIEWRPPTDPTRRQLAWNVFLLPYLEQEALYRRLNLNTPFDSPQNATAAATVLPVFLCPSYPKAEPLIDGRGRSDYGGMYGERITSRNQPPKGAMIYDQPISIRMIPDGTAYTIQIGEDPGFPDGQWINGANIFDQAFPINHAPAWENDLRSDHPGGANALFCDGSVRFLRETMDLRTLAALCTRAGGEIVSDF